MAENPKRSRIEMVEHNPRPPAYPVNFTTGYNRSTQRYAQKLGHFYKNERCRVKPDGEPTLVFAASHRTKFWRINNIGCDIVWIHYGFPDAWIGPTTDKSNQEQELEYTLHREWDDDSGIGRGTPLHPGGSLQGDHNCDIWAFSNNGSILSYNYMGG